MAGLVETNMTTRTRRGFLARATGLTTAAGIGLIAGGGALAQNATPPSGGANACGVPIGTAVDFKNVEGAVVAKLAVTKITDPFTGYNPSYPPPRGNRFILLSVSVENTSVNNFVFDPGRIYIQDSDGFVIWPSSVDLGPEPAEPGIPYQEIPSATTVSGVIGYVLVQGVAPARAFFGPSSDRMVLIADLV